MMKRLFIAIAAAATAAAITGCQTAEVQVDGQGKWSAKVRSHWFKRDVDKFSASVDRNGVFSIDLNGYKGDASEQLPAFTREMWAGIAMGMRLGLTAASPAVATVPLTTEAADANAVSQAVAAQGQARAQVLKAKAKLKAAQCDDGSCGEADCSTCTR